ncbi:hypothetical protein like AT2G17190 [Hibiscus trionum]|uniref:Uncharacterized protein n=1 Tax=Hibiscus trionum TaxID=183268 RepID=A0A9W7HZQ1_HIBTR|nr:hypothetical protein like AT2G17190 [Hibiscus trionum]
MGGLGGADRDTTASMEAFSGDAVTVNVSCSSGSKFSVQINLHSTVLSFKAVLARNCDIPADQQRLIYNGRILKDDQTLQSYGLEADHTVHLVRRFAPTPPAPTTDSRAVGSDDGEALGAGEAGLRASLFPELGFGSAGSFGDGLPNFEHVQQQLARNPGIIDEIMDLPAVQILMNNPEMTRNFILNNPRIAELIYRNPELAPILNDTSAVLRILEDTRNHELMHEMTRNTDRAMSNIESSPEGFNMLCGMYEIVHEPFLDATTMAGATGNGSAEPFTFLLETQGGNQARDWSTNQSTSASGTTPNSPAPNTNRLPNPWSSSAGGGVQTNTTRSDPRADSRPQAPAGLDGLGLPPFEGLFGAMQDTNSLNQLMQNPAMSQMTQSLPSNPQYMNQVLGLNPQLQSLVGSISQPREVMQNSQFHGQWISPEMMQQLSTLQQSRLSQLSRTQSTQEPAQTGAGGGPGTHNNMGLEALMAMFGGLGAGSLGVRNRSYVRPEELYGAQLLQLQEMGFIDIRENIQALIASAGNVRAAVERLLGNPGR